jgi:CMP-N-acetylneuraminic acid synthetase
MAFKIFIPARKGSKGFPGKNRILLDCTLNVALNYSENKKIPIIIDTDDKKIIKKVNIPGVYIHEREKRLAGDKVSIKDVILNNPMITKNDTIIMLYLTYPYRAASDIAQSVKNYKKSKAKSLLCAEPPLTHPYMCVYKEFGKTKQFVEHNLYRRQDYPEAFELSHYIAIFEVKELKKLNNNLYNQDTFLQKIKRVKDIDYKGDLNEESIFNNSNERLSYGSNHFIKIN